jgi:amidase
MTQTAHAEYPTTAQLVADLAERRTSAVELLEAAIARINARDGAVNAVVVRDFARARTAAAEADAALARGERRPLLGVPMTVKESYNVAGLPTTWGMPQFTEYRATEDADAIVRLKNAGAVILGKTNVPYALGEWQSYNAIYGTTNNPWDHTRTPGGSSGGSAASLAAGYVSLEMGSDIGGSLRAPAHYCGVFSHKPSRGALSSRGHVMPGSFGGTPDLSVIGPLARTASDLALAMDILAGPGELEATAYRLAFPPPRHETLRDYRVLVLDSHPLLPAAASVRQSIASLAQKLRAAGATVAETSPLLPNLSDATRVFVQLLMPVLFARESEERKRNLAAGAAALPPDAEGMAVWRLRAAVASHADWLAADEARMRLAYAWHALFRAWDVVVFPAMPTPAFAQDQSPDMNARTIDIDGTKYPYFDQIAYAAFATAPGLPATTAPIERAPSGLPIGVQIIGPFLEDRTTIRFAELIEREFGGFVPPPEG